MKKFFTWLFYTWNGGYWLGIILGLIAGIIWHIAFLNLQNHL